jgi:hypothetical protein
MTRHTGPAAAPTHVSALNKMFLPKKRSIDPVPMNAYSRDPRDQAAIKKLPIEKRKVPISMSKNIEI